MNASSRNQDTKKYPLRILIIVSLTLNFLAVVGSVTIIMKKGGLPWLSRKVVAVLHGQQGGDPNNRLSVFEQLSVGPNDIIFLGDSLFEYGEWHELLDDARAKNRAISGDCTQTILDRLSPIIEGRPRHVVILCGINNFQNNIPYAQTANEYAQIAGMISSQSPHTDIWLLPTLPVNTSLYQQWIFAFRKGVHMPTRTEIEVFNAFIKTLAVDRPRIHYVDMPEFLNDRGELREDYTLDGLHLNGRGLKEIATRLTELGIKDAE